MSTSSARKSYKKPLSESNHTLVTQDMTFARGSAAGRRLSCSPIVRTGLQSMGLKAANTALMFLTTMLLARLLGAQEFGIYSYAYSLVTLLAIPAHVGLPDLVVREIAQSIACNRPDLIRGIWRWTRKVVAIFSLALLIGLGPALLIWEGGLQSPQGLTLAWALTLVPLIAMGNLRGAALRGLQHIVAGQLPEYLVRPSLFILLIVGTAVFFNDHFSAPLAMALHAASSLVAFSIGDWILRRYLPSIQNTQSSVNDSRKWLISGVLFGLIAGFGIVNSQAGIVILGIFQTPDQVGVYRVATQVAGLASFGLEAVNLVVAPRFAELYARRDITSLQRWATSGARIALAFNLLFAIIFLVVGKYFLTFVFGSEFTDSYTPSLILLIGQMTNSAVGSVGYLLNMTGYERETARGLAIAAGLNMILALLLIPFWKAEGAATATALALTFWKVFLWWRARKILRINSMAFRLPAF